MSGVYTLLAIVAAAKLADPTLALSPEEARRLSDSMCAVLRHFPIETTQRMIDIATCIGVHIEVLGPRVVAVIRARRA